MNVSTFAANLVMKILYLFTFASLFVLTGCHSVNTQNGISHRELKIQKVIYFNPEVFPDIDEIKEPTYSAFYSAVSDRIGHYRNYKILRVDMQIPYDDVSKELIQESCENNNAHFAIVPKVKYFKVGIGKYIFSNQVVVSLKFYNADGNYLTETHYDTYKKNARLLGSAENFIITGTNGAIKNLLKKVRKLRKDFVEPVEI